MNDQPQYADDAGRFRLDSRIATGGMGEVWRATDTVLGRPVAVKLLKTELSDDPTFRQRFETEARNAAALHHPGVAAVFDVGERTAADGSGQPRPFLVMELVEGRPLSALVGPGRELAPEAVRELLAQVGDALGAAHRAGIVHRDVKPANLIVTPQQRVKVTDFGIARAAEAVGITRTGAIMGTPQYISPEQAQGLPATAASDVYSLGVVAYECLVGTRPFDAESAVATALAHIREPVPDLPDAVPADLAAVITRALAKDPAERYEDGSAFAAALRDPATAVLQRPAVVPPPVVPMPDEQATQVMGPVSEPAPLPEPVTTTTTTTDQPAKRSVVPIVIAVLLLVALAIVLTLLLTGNGDEEPTAGDPNRTRGQGQGQGQGQSESPSPTQTSQDTGVSIDEDDFLGRQVEEVEADLRELGLEVSTREQDNSDPDADGQVTGVNPTGDLQQGETVEVSFNGDAPDPEPEPEPTQDPEPEPEPTIEVPPTPTAEPPSQPLPTEPQTEAP